MLSARNLCGLLSENTDEYASEYVFVLPSSSTPFSSSSYFFVFSLTTISLTDPLNSVFTTHGTLLGYSDTTIIKKARKVAALLGVTWRSANQAPLNNNHQDSESTNSATLLLKVLTTIRNADGKLSIMVTEIDKMVAAICDVKESLLVAALVDEVQPSSGDHLPESVSDDDAATVDVEESSKSIQNIASSDIEQGPSSDSANEGEEGQDLPTLTTNKGKSKEDAENSTSTPTPPSSSSSKPKPSQMQILIWRVEAMAEALRDDLRDFKMPQGTL